MRFDFYDQAPKEIVSACNLCGGNRFILLSTVDRYHLEAPTVKCVDCGLIFLSYRMTPAAYHEFYAGGHYRRLLTEWRHKPFTAQTIEQDQTRYAANLSSWLGSQMNGARSGLLLDLGGSTGIVAARLALDYDLDATVVEPSAAEAERARDKGLAVANVGIGEYESGGNRYDLILLCRTVDHLLDIKGTFKRVRSWLAPGGRFFVDYVSVVIPKIDHPYYLRSNTMRRYLEQTGFVVRHEGRITDDQHFGVLAEGM